MQRRTDCPIKADTAQVVSVCQCSVYGRFNRSPSFGSKAKSVADCLINCKPAPSREGWKTLGSFSQCMVSTPALQDSCLPRAVFICRSVHLQISRGCHFPNVKASFTQLVRTAAASDQHNEEGLSRLRR